MKKKILLICLLILFIAGMCVSGVSASKTIKYKKYKVTLTDTDINNLKNGYDEYSILKSTHKKLKDKWGYEPIYKKKKVKRHKYKYKYKLASRVTSYESWSYSSAYKTPKNYVYAGTKTVTYGNYNYDFYIKYRSKKKVTYYKKVKVKVGKKMTYRTGTVKVDIVKRNGKFLAFWINDYPGNGVYRDLAMRKISL